LTSFAGIFVPAAVREAVSDEAWLAAMLDAERALAEAESRAGAIPREAADAIAGHCRADGFDLGAIQEQGRAVANAAEPLVRALRERVNGDAARYVHFGATSQDILDTAAMLVSRTAVELVVSELDGVAAACARLAEAHRETPLAARTLLQQAVPTTFGAKAAGWLVGIVEARDGLRALRFRAQLGGAAGTLAPLGDRAMDVLTAFASVLDLDEPVVPWHTQRAPVAAIGAALDAAAAACAKPALDVILLAQSEIGEVAEAEGGGSSTLPHKRNPAKAVLARACARLVHANVRVLVDGEHEHERAAGAWQAEWTALSEALAHAGGSAWAVRECLEGLEVRPDRMRANMSDDVYAERDAFAERGLADGSGDWLGSAGTFVDRALARWRESA
jgi:3-carboxy-cis,cis-muconate cycloisomerase